VFSGSAAPDLGQAGDRLPARSRDPLPDDYGASRRRLSHRLPPSAFSQRSRRNFRAHSQACLAEGSGNQPRAIGVVRVEPNQQKTVKLLSALIGASAIVVMAVLAVALNEEQTGTGTGTGTVATEAVGGMSTGATVTTTTPPTAAPVPVAQPTMKAVVPKGFR